MSDFLSTSSVISFDRLTASGKGKGGERLSAMNPLLQPALRASEREREREGFSGSTGTHGRNGAPQEARRRRRHS